MKTTGGARSKTGGQAAGRPVRALMAAGAMLVVFLAGATPAGAEHEYTIGQTYYSDGTTAKTATPGTVLTINASLGGRAIGIDGGVNPDRYWFVTVGKPFYTSAGKYIACYDGYRFVDRVPHYTGPGNTIPNSNFTVPTWLASGQWEVCFYSQPFELVTGPVLLTVP